MTAWVWGRWIEGVPMIPDYDAVVVDEAHELVARVTQAATDELWVAEIERAARRSQRQVEGSEADDLADAADTLRGALDEARPGNYCFYDGTQAALGSCAWSDCAVTVLTQVVSCQPGAEHSVVDAGALALSKDPGPRHLGGGWRWGMGAVFPDLAAYRGGRPDPEIHLTTLSQEHGKVSAPLPVGTRLRVVPNHSCLAVPCFGRYWVVRGEEVVGRWGIFQGRE